MRNSLIETRTAEKSGRRSSRRPRGAWLFGLLLMVLPPGSYAQAAHGILREVFMGIEGPTVAHLTNHVSFPDNPTSTNLVTDFFEAPTDIADHYGQRMHGYVLPPATGNYTFWIASDDGGSLYLSTDENPANRRAIASVPGWTSSREWNKYPEQRSAPIHLEEGKLYYISALMKEHGGGDNLAVRWQLPNGTIEEPIPASRLLPFGVVFSAPVVAEHPAGISVVEGGSAIFEVKLANTTPVAYQWQRNGVDIPGATSAIYIHAPVPLADDGARFRVLLENNLGAVQSQEALLTVTADVTPPTVVAALNIGLDRLAVTFSEAVESQTGLNAGNYQLDKGVTISGAVYGGDESTVILNTSAMVIGDAYTLTINNVRDQAATPNPIAANTQFTFVAVDFVPVDIGGLDLEGSSRPVPGGYEVTGAGRDIGGRADQFHFSYQERAGNFDIKVRVTSLDHTDLWAKAGLVAREDLEAASRYAAALATPSLGGNIFSARTTAGAEPSLSGTFPVNFPYNWLRLQRNANNFRGFASHDGQTWHLLGSASMSLPGALFVGMGVSSRHPDQFTRAVFLDVNDASGEPVSAMPPRFQRENLGPSSRRTGLVISEIMYHPAPREDGRELEFVELFNSQPVPEDLSGFRLTGTISYTFPEGTVLPAGGFLVLAKSAQDLEAVYGIRNVLGPYSRSLKTESGVVQLRNSIGAMLLEAEYSALPPWPAAAGGAGHSLVLARPSYGEGNLEAWAPSTLKGGSPGRVDPVFPDPLEKVVINEFLAHTDEPLLDYIELYNHSNESVDLSGAFLSDRPHVNKFQIPAGTILPPRGFVVFDEIELGFALSAAGEAIYFTNPENTRVIDAIRFGAQANGISMGRHPDGAPEFHLLAALTPGGPNASLWISDVIINEIMFNPLSGLDEDTYVELHNRSEEAVDLSDWRFVDGISFRFPEGTVIPGGGYLVVAKDRERLFSLYPDLNENNTVGNFGGRLSNSGERLALAMPVERTLTAPNYVVVDELTYRDGGRWGEWINRGGSSLELIDPGSDNRRPSNWTQSDEREKSQWITIEHTGVLDHGQGTANELHIFMPGAGECLIDNVQVSVQGGPNLVPNPAFEGGLNGWVRQGNHVNSSLHTEEGFNSNRSLRLRATGGGDNGANRVKIRLNSSISPGSTATIRAQGRWLAGHTNVILRLKGNYLEAVGNLPPPANLGTPGRQNSAFASNVGPAIYDVNHWPVLPAANQAVTVTARAHDPDGVNSIVLRYREDPSSTLMTVPMRDDGTAGDAVAGDGVYTAIIPGRPSGRLVAFHIEATDGRPVAATSRYPEEVPEVEMLVRFGETELFGAFGTYRMWFTQATINEWTNRERLSNQRLSGTLVYGDRVIHNIAARYRGSPFIRPGYSSPTSGITAYSFQVPRDDRFLGARSFNLDGLEQPGRDDTLQREKMSFWIAGQLGVPFSHQTYIYVFLNGVRRGLVYTDSQHIDSDYVSTWWPEDDQGELFKIDDWFEFNDNVQREFNVDARLQDYTTTGGVKKQARYRWNWNKRSNRGLDDDYSQFFQLVDAVNTPGTDAYTSAVESVVDLEQWMRVFAARRIVGDWDGYGYDRGKNTWTYKPAERGWQMILWDLDFSLGGGSHGPTHGLFGANDPTVARMYNHPPFRRAYLRAFHDAVHGPLLPENMHPVMDANYAAFQANGINVSGPGAIKSWVETRRNYILGQLGQVAANFAISTSNGNNFSTANQYLTLEGAAPVNVKTLTINGVAYPVTWTSVTAWRVRLPLQPGSNSLLVQGWDSSDELVENATRSIVVTYTGAGAAPQDHLVINEIMYNPANPGAEFVEIHNTSATHAFDLTGYRLRGVDFNFEDGTVIQPNGFLVVVNDQAAFQAAYGSGIPIAGVYQGRLHPQGERLRLARLPTETAPELVVDQVAYDVLPPWPPAANGAGPSLQRIDPAQASNHPGNWTAVLDENQTTEPQWQFVSVTGVASWDRIYVYLQSAGEFHLDDMFLARGSVPEVGNNHIRNGNFEEALSGPWNVSPNHANSQLTTAVKRSGNRSLRVVATSGGTTLSSSIWQDTAPLEVGEVYTLSYWYLPNPNGATLTVRFRFSETTPGAIQSTHSVRPGAVSSAQFTPGAPNSVQAALPPFPPLWINEIQPQNSGGATHSGGAYDPWVELHNAGSAPISLDGFYLTDDFSAPNKWAFPAGAAMGPGEFRMVWLSGRLESSQDEWHANFTIDPIAGSLFLMRRTNPQTVLIDYVQYDQVAPGWSYGRFPDGDPHHWQIFHLPTPSQLNNPASNPATIWINEWMASNAGTLADPADGEYKDWIELYNPGAVAVDLSGYTLTDRLFEPDRFIIPHGTIIGPGAFLLVWADDKPELNAVTQEVHANFRLSIEGEAIGLFAPDGTVVDAVTFGPQTTDISQGRWPDGAGAPFYFFSTPTPRAPNILTDPPHQPDPDLPGPGSIIINEWMADNATIIADPADGEFKNWFELYNPGTTAIDLSGSTISDKLDEPERWTVPDGTVIPPGGFLFIWADGKPELMEVTGGLHTNFSLSRSGEAIGVYAPDGTVIDLVIFGPQQTDISQGRWPDGNPAPFYFFTTPTPGASNVLDGGPGPVRIVEVGFITEGFLLSWTAIPNARYLVQFKNSLSDLQWTNLTGEITADEPVLSVLDDQALLFPQRYYRVVQLD
jgi:hypothetical protein